MESRWFLYQGQTLENTKISERSHALHATKNAWEGITGHLDRKKKVQEKLDKQEQTRNYLKDGSRKMMEKWENSIENIRKRKEEKRIAMIEQEREDRLSRFAKLQAEQDIKRQRYVDKKLKEIFMKSGNAKQITSAFIFSETLLEREKQREFNQFRKDHEAADQAKYDQFVIEAARIEAEKNENDRKNEMKKGREYGEYLKKVIDENAANERHYRENRMKQERMDNIKAAEEMKCVEELEQRKKLERKLELKEERRKQEEKAEFKRKQQAAEEKEINDVVNIYHDAKHTIDCLKKQREEDLRAEAVQRREEIVKLVAVAKSNRDEIEEQSRLKAVAAKEAEVLALMKAKEELRQKEIKDRLEDRKQFLEKQAYIKNKEIELKKWEFLNSYKSVSMMREYDELQKKKTWDKEVAFRQDLREQIAIDEEEKRKNREEEIIRSKVSYVEDDNKFFAYANEVLENATQKGRPTYPIEKAIEEYKRTYRLNSDENNTTNTSSDKPHKHKRPCKCKQTN